MPHTPFSASVGYRWLDAWVMASVIQLGTHRFCLAHLDRKLDPCGRWHDQMVMAARSGVANIAEGYARRTTSTETELRLYDVARASLDELAGDYRSFLLFRGELPWSDRDPEENAVFRTPLDKAEFASDIERASAAHVLAQYGKFARWLDGEDAVTAARALLVLCSRGILLLRRKIEQAHGDFLARGGFAENLSKDRIGARVAGAATDAAEGNAPRCPKCGKPMQRRLAKRGVRAGKAFWSCPDYPECRGARDAE